MNIFIQLQICKIYKTITMVNVTEETQEFNRSSGYFVFIFSIHNFKI